MVLLWVDDCIFYADSSKAIDKVIDSLRDKFLLEKDMAGFLGVSIHRDKWNKTVTLTHEGLIDRILHVMQLEDYNSNFTIADKMILCKDLNGEPYQE